MCWDLATTARRIPNEPPSTIKLTDYYYNIVITTLKDK